MPPVREFNSKQQIGRSLSTNDTVMSAKVYHPATNLMPVTPPVTPTGLPPTFLNYKPNQSTWGRQNSNNGGRCS